MDKIGSVDTFVFLDDVQFKKNEFQNRNKILVNGESKWLTVPVTFNFGDKIREVKVVNNNRWPQKMRRTIELNYASAPCYDEYSDGLYRILQTSWNNLSDLNRATVEWLMTCNHITTPVHTSSSMPALSTDPTQRLIDICKTVDADKYLSGTGGREYLDLRAFERAGIDVEFQQFLHPTYNQCYSSPVPFVSNLSAIDMLFNCGEGS